MGKVAATALGLWMLCVTVLVVWPTVGTAPWEKSSAICEDALIRRRGLYPFAYTFDDASSREVRVANQEVKDFCGDWRR